MEICPHEAFRNCRGILILFFLRGIWCLVKLPFQKKPNVWINHTFLAWDLPEYRIPQITLNQKCQVVVNLMSKLKDNSKKTFSLKNVAISKPHILMSQLIEGLIKWETEATPSDLRTIYKLMKYLKKNSYHLVVKHIANTMFNIVIISRIHWKKKKSWFISFLNRIRLKTLIRQNRGFVCHFKSFIIEIENEEKMQGLLIRRVRLLYCRKSIRLIVDFD